MSLQLPDNVIDNPDLRDRTGVFRDREHAGEHLAELLAGYRDSNALVLAIPAGGVPVAVTLARRLRLPLEVVVVSKIVLPWNSEAGYGAVAFDGTVRLNEQLLPRLGLREQQIRQGIERTLAKVSRRGERLRGMAAFPPLADRPVLLVDDGIASGFTMLTAIEALGKAGAEHLLVAVPTAHWKSALTVAVAVETLYCPNLRQGPPFAVADAYQRWADVDEDAAAALLAEYSEPI